MFYTQIRLSVVRYISSQLWAWNAGNLLSILKSVQITSTCKSAPCETDRTTSWICISTEALRVRIAKHRLKVSLEPYVFVSPKRNSSQSFLDPPNQKADKWGGKMYKGKCNLLNDIKRWRSCSGVPRSCVYRICLWPLRRDVRSDDLIGAGRAQRSDWPTSVLANNVSTRIDRLHACRDMWQLTATEPRLQEAGVSNRYY